MSCTTFRKEKKEKEKEKEKRYINKTIGRWNYVKFHC
jgi:hypothetical protein